jgi:hypothetical protein
MAFTIYKRFTRDLQIYILYNILIINNIYIYNRVFVNCKSQNRKKL